MNTGKAKGIRRQIKKHKKMLANEYFIGLLSLPFRQRLRAAWLILKGLP